MTSGKVTPYTLPATLFGVGFIPLMPGTLASAVCAIAYYFMPGNWFYSEIGLPASYIFFTIPILIAAFFAGVHITGKAEDVLGQDAGSIVWDEAVGYFVAVLWLPHSLWMAIYTFALFRVFDIAKPLFIRTSQKLRGGWGVMVDDLLAGICTNVFMQIMLLIYPSFFHR